MPSLQYINQSAPFWDFVANLEDQGASHPFFVNGRRARGPVPPQFPNGPFNPFGWGPRTHWAGPHRDGNANQPGPSTETPPQYTEKEKTQGEEEMNDASSDDDTTIKTPTTEAEAAAEEETRNGGRAHGKCGAQWGHRHRGGRCGRRGGPCGQGPRGGFGHPFNFANLGQFFDGNVENLFGQGQSVDNSTQEFRPEADIFDTETSYLVHVSLPGAKKEDVGVNWDAEKSELVVSGVIHRPDVDEDLLKTLALDERKVGVFERKIRLGTRVNPAQVDADGVSAKMEEGILKIEVPKLDKDYVEVKKVDIQ